MREDLPVVYVQWASFKLGRYFVSGACSLYIILFYCFNDESGTKICKTKKGKLCLKFY